MPRTITPPEVEICDLFVSLQGEGAWSGTPMLFVRFWGCPNACPFCDEPRHRDPAARRTLSIPALLAELTALNPEVRRVVLTGGEPLAAPALFPCVAALKEAGYWVAMESSGVGGMVPPQLDWLTLSPKGAVVESLYTIAHEIKYVVGADLPLPLEWEILERAARHPLVWVQPMARGDELDVAAHRRCIELVMKGAGRLRLSLQTHKWLRIP